MIRKDDFEEKIHKTDDLLDRLKKEHEHFSLLEQGFISEYGVTADQIKEYLGNPANFTPEEWETIHKVRAELDAKLFRELSTVKNTKKTKQAYKDMQNMQPHWIFVR